MKCVRVSPVSSVEAITVRGHPGQPHTVRVVCVWVALGREDNVLATAGGHARHLVLAARHGGDGGQIVKAVVSPVRCCVAEAELAGLLPGGGESVHAAAGAGAVQEGAGQQVNWGH